MNEYVVFKLISGEQMIGTLLNDISEGIVVLDPIIVKMVHVVRDGEHVEQAITSRFCQFAEDNIFAFHHRNLIYKKKLDPNMVQYYARIIKALDAEDNNMQPAKAEQVDIPKDRILH